MLVVLKTCVLELSGVGGLWLPVLVEQERRLRATDTSNIFSSALLASFDLITSEGDARDFLHIQNQPRDKYQTPSRPGNMHVVVDIFARLSFFFMSDGKVGLSVDPFSRRESLDSEEPVMLLQPRLLSLYVLILKSYRKMCT